MRLVLIIAALFCCTLVLADDEADYAAMPETEGKDIVFSQCSQCHSMDIVFQQRLRRSRWNELMDWMTEEMGMVKLLPNQREVIVDYLTRHYGTSARP